MKMHIRPRRNRKNAGVRDLVRENQLHCNDFIYPVFVTEGNNQQQAIRSMPGISRFSADLLLHEIEQCLNLGIKAFAPFPNISEQKKDSMAKESYNENGLYPSVIRMIKSNFPEAILFADVAMDPYSSDGHDGIVKNGQILNDETLEVLGKMALTQAAAGADFIAPSDMMDGRVGYLRQMLDTNGFEQVSILAYTAKYSSSFYGPFRDALDSAPKFGDKKTYQMDPANAKEAIREARLDLAEGADMIMVKPALAYLDVIQSLSAISDVPVAAYQVSGEYAMVKAAGLNGWLDAEKAMLECLLSIKRAGAKVILSYFAKEFAQLQQH